MSDKELLELAAKAAGFGAPGSGGTIWTLSEYPKGSGRHGALWNYVGCMDDAELWNPLVDDGDALRLAVKLNIEFACFDDSQKVNAGVWSEDSKPYDCMTPYNGDKQAATRRAIVRAAAEIGKTMP